MGPGSRLRASGTTTELLPPGLERLVERTPAGISFFKRENRAAAIAVDDRDIEPRALFQELKIALHVDLDRRQSDEEKSRRHLDGKTRERRTPYVLARLHQDAGYVLDVAE